jgi:hypothetical protein
MGIRRDYQNKSTVELVHSGLTGNKNEMFEAEHFTYN